MTTAQLSMGSGTSDPAVAGELPCEHSEQASSQRSDLGRYVYCRSCAKALHAHL